MHQELVGAGGKPTAQRRLIADRSQDARCFGVGSLHVRHGGIRPGNRSRSGRQPGDRVAPLELGDQRGRPGTCDSNGFNDRHTEFSGQPFTVESIAATACEVAHVQRKNHRHPKPLDVEHQTQRQREVRGVGDQDDHLRAGFRAEPTQHGVAGDRFIECRGLQAVGARQVDHEVAALRRADETAFLALDGDARIVRDLLTAAGQAIEKCGLAAVRQTHQRNTQVASEQTCGSVHRVVRLAPHHAHLLRLTASERKCGASDTNRQGIATGPHHGDHLDLGARHETQLDQAARNRRSLGVAQRFTVFDHVHDHTLLAVTKDAQQRFRGCGRNRYCQAHNPRLDANHSRLQVRVFRSAYGPDIVQPMDGGTGGGRAQLNVYGEPLASCSQQPLTGWTRNGCCETDASDHGVHTVCAVMSADFLEFSRARGNDLSTARPDLGFPGLQAGDRWCLCAARWLEAHRDGKAPRVHLRATHRQTLSIVALAILKPYAADLD